MSEARSKVLVVGGAGYVGSATVEALLAAGHAVWVLDDLSTGRPELNQAPYFVQARAGDPQWVPALLKAELFDTVLHFAARSLVGESVAQPDAYFENNVTQTRALLDAMADAGLRRFVFSSSCAVFGDPGNQDISENLPKKPTNPYGATKLAVEQELEKRATSGLQSISLRYFNAAGASASGKIGELHDPETHLLPRLIRAASRGEELPIYGTDYPTPDGTCVRDYVHVTDLAQAHVAAVERLLQKPEAAGVAEAFNLGSARGYSVREVLDAAERVLGKKVRTRQEARRPGDPPRLVAASGQAKRELGFEPKLDLDTIIASAAAWMRKTDGLALSKAVFLDRDGTINEDPGYLSEPSSLELIPGVGEAMGELKRAGYKLVVVTNQSGVNRGIIPIEKLPRIHRRMQELLAPFGAEIDHFQICIHHPEENCPCRKPLPKLLVDGARAVRADLAVSYMVGDKLADLGAGAAAGVRGHCLVRTGYGRDTEAKLAKAGGPTPSYVGDDLAEVANWILSAESKR